jgi:hypothetical protein
MRYLTSGLRVVVAAITIMNMPALDALAQTEYGRIADTRITQEALRIKGYRPGPVDGICGPRLLAAMRRYAQNERDISARAPICADLVRYSYFFQKEQGAGLSRSLGIDVVTPGDVSTAVSECGVRRGGRIEDDVGLARHTAIAHRRALVRLGVGMDPKIMTCWVNYLERVQSRPEPMPNARSNPPQRRLPRSRRRSAQSLISARAR